MNFNVRFSESARENIRKYIFLYADYFLELFSDTGIWCEIDIQDGYRRSAKELYRQIYDIIEEKLSQEIVPFSFSDAELRTTTLSFGKRRIALEYTEMADKRIITHIQIWYKH